ncbi:MAG: hypothetical protein Kow006_08840 [Gammaproteobacteria bacterium]
MPDRVCELRELILPITPEPAALDLGVSRGEVMLLDGGMGSGKSTLLKLICGLLRPRRGNVKLFGEDLARVSQRKLIRLRQRLGVVFERDGLIGSWSARENLLLPLRYRAPRDNAGNEARIRAVLERVGESEAILDHKVTELTGRQRRRLALLRALVLEPELMVLDELPTYLDTDDTATASLLEALIGSECTLIAAAPASWSRFFPGRKVVIARLEGGGR